MGEKEEGKGKRPVERRIDGLLCGSGTRAYLHPCACQRCAAYHRRHSALTDLCLLPWLCATSEDSVTQCSTASVEARCHLPASVCRAGGNEASLKKGAGPSQLRVTPGGLT